MNTNVMPRKKPSWVERLFHWAAYKGVTHNLSGHQSIDVHISPDGVASINVWAMTTIRKRDTVIVQTSAGEIVAVIVHSAVRHPDEAPHIVRIVGTVKYST